MLFKKRVVRTKFDNYMLELISNPKRWKVNFCKMTYYCIEMCNIATNCKYKYRNIVLFTNFNICLSNKINYVYKEN